MHLRAFGSTGLEVSPIGLGCARIGGIFQDDPKGFIRLVDAALDSGITFFDTADMYSQGESETILGRALARRRSRVVIATKAGYLLPTQRRAIAAIKPLVRPLIRLLRIKRASLPSGVRGALTQDFSAGYLVKAVERSLRRLRTDYIDVLQLHSPTAQVIDRGDWEEPLDRLKRAGKIRHYGIACDDEAAGEATLRKPRVASLQVTVSLLERWAVGALLSGARAAGVGVIARECLANGLLAKTEADVDLASYCHSPEDVERRRAQLAHFRAEAASRSVSLAGLAVQYARDLDGVSVALVGARNAAQLTGLLRQIPNE